MGVVIASLKSTKNMFLNGGWNTNTGILYIDANVSIRHILSTNFNLTINFILLGRVRKEIKMYLT
jgi:hypothetical protein